MESNETVAVVSMPLAAVVALAVVVNAALNDFENGVPFMSSINDAISDSRIIDQSDKDALRLYLKGIAVSLDEALTSLALVDDETATLVAVGTLLAAIRSHSWR